MSSARATGIPAMTIQAPVPAGRATDGSPQTNGFAVLSIMGRSADERRAATKTLITSRGSVNQEAEDLNGWRYRRGHEPFLPESGETPSHR